MKPLIACVLGAIGCLQAHAQNVGIGTTTPSEYFTVKKDGIGICQESADGSAKIGFTTFGPNAYLQTHTNSPLLISTNRALPQLVLSTTGNLGIGNINPANKFQIGSMGNTGYTGNDIAFGNGINASTMVQTTANSQYRSTTDIVLMPQNAQGYIGINTIYPYNKLQIGSVGNTGFGGNDIAFGNGAEVTAWSQTVSASQIVSNTDFVLMPRNTGAGNVGINTYSPTNKLQIGSVGTTGFGGNDIAFGNGVQAMAMFQGNTFAQIASTTDIAIMPKNNGRGRVGINTTSPNYPLHVADFVNSPSICYAYFAKGIACTDDNVGGTLASMPVSIYATSRVLATEFNAYSDARIKNIIGTSNAANDLATLEAIRITDYSMKDVIKYGNKTYKKVIAQEVEKVYPQAVSQQPGYIPNVYQVTEKITKQADGYHLYFNQPHQLSAKATMLRLMINENHYMSEHSITSIPSATEVIIKADLPSIDKAFVYGEQVPDFRTVDYEGLTTLNISATQELSKIVRQQQATIEALLKRVNTLEQQQVPAGTKVAVLY